MNQHPDPYSPKFSSNPIDAAIARCDEIQSNIERIARDMKEATEKAQAAIQDAIRKLQNHGRVA